MGTVRYCRVLSGIVGYCQGLGGITAEYCWKPATGGLHEIPLSTIYCGVLWNTAG